MKRINFLKVFFGLLLLTSSSYGNEFSFLGELKTKTQVNNESVRVAIVHIYCLNDIAYIRFSNGIQKKYQGFPNDFYNYKEDAFIPMVKNATTGGAYTTCDEAKWLIDGKKNPK